MRKFMFSLIGVFALVLVAGAVYVGITGNPFAVAQDASLPGAGIEDEAREIVLTTEPMPEPEQPMADTSMPGLGYMEQFKNLNIIVDMDLEGRAGSLPIWRTRFDEQLTKVEA